LAFLWVDRDSRKWLRTIWPWLAIVIGALFLTPAIVWNQRHDWVTFKHVARQTGAAQQDHWFNGNFWELLGSQIGVLGPALVVILVGASVYARRKAQQTLAGTADHTERAVVFLLWMGLPLFTICLLGAIRSKMQINWPVAAYFSWMILA